MTIMEQHPKYDLIEPNQRGTGDRLLTAYRMLLSDYFLSELT